ncbi:MAG: hypothetical protein HPY44_04320 [Armatimonadetes bacterium]|nr:hypothetical protein [Armatimonadota bacterium]
MPCDYKYEDGGEPQVLDVVEAPLREASPNAHQPENWLIDDEYWWERVRPADDDDLGLIARELAAPNTPIFGCSRDRISESELVRRHLRWSLALVAPAKATLIKEWNEFRNRPRLRMRFEMGRHVYVFAVTDPSLEGTYLRQQYEFGEHQLYPNGPICADDEALVLTVSLGEPFQGALYKLVAAAFAVPDWVVKEASMQRTVGLRR